PLESLVARSQRRSPAGSCDQPALALHRSAHANAAGTRNLRPDAPNSRKWRCVFAGREPGSRGSLTRRRELTKDRKLSYEPSSGIGNDWAGTLEAEALEPRGESRRLDAEDVGGSPGPRNPPTSLLQRVDDVVAFPPSEVRRRQHPAFDGTNAILEDVRRGSQLHPSRQRPGIECPVDAEGTALGQDDRTLDHVSQLSNVSRPAVRRELLEGLLRERGRGAVEPARREVQEVNGQQPNVFQAVAEWRQLDGEDGQTVVQVATEAPGLTLLPEIVIG